jgi:hypothetical protein
LLVAGPLAAWIVGTLEGAAVAGGLSALGAGLYSIGIPNNSVLKYETAVKADKFLLVVHGTAAEAANAKNILSITGPLELDQHDLEVAKKAAQG